MQKGVPIISTPSVIASSPPPGAALRGSSGRLGLVGRRLLWRERLVGLLRLGRGCSRRLLARLAVLRKLRQLRLKLGLARGDFLRELFRDAFAQGDEFLNVQRVQIDLGHVMPSTPLKS